MLIKILKSKIHRVKVTASNLHYPGSIGIDAEMMKAVNILPFESVLIADLNNGNRLETYVVPEKAGSRKIEILGAAAQLIKKGDTIIIFSFGYCTSAEAKKIKPKIITLDKSNKIIKLFKR